MNAFLITSPKGTSEWKSSFLDVQTEMGILEKRGVVSNVTVEMFKDSLLAQSITYDYNGQEWEKRN